MVLTVLYTCFFVQISHLDDTFLTCFFQVFLPAPSLRRCFTCETNDSRFITFQLCPNFPERSVGIPMEGNDH